MSGLRGKRGFIIASKVSTLNISPLTITSSENRKPRGRGREVIRSRPPLFPRGPSLFSSERICDESLSPLVFFFFQRRHLLLFRFDMKKGWGAHPRDGRGVDSDTSPPSCFSRRCSQTLQVSYWCLRRTCTITPLPPRRSLNPRSPSTRGTTTI